MDLSKWSTYWQQDSLPPWDSNNPCSQLINWLESETLREIEKSDALELGCGSGRNTIYMQQNGFKNVVGVDVVPEAIEICRKNEQVIKNKQLLKDEANMKEYIFVRFCEIFLALSLHIQMEISKINS